MKTLTKVKWDSVVKPLEICSFNYDSQLLAEPIPYVTTKHQLELIEFLSELNLLTILPSIS